MTENMCVAYANLEHTAALLCREVSKLTDEHPDSAPVAGMLILASPNI